MSHFASGIREYVHAKAVADVYFPVDMRGNASICCAQCFLYRDASRRCSLTGEISPYPDKYVGGACPLVPANEFNEGETE